MAALTLVLAACAGPTGPQGPAGPPGPTEARYVGSWTCNVCHKEIADFFSKSGHAYAMTKVASSKPPEYPYSSVPTPPAGYTWADTSYVVGGYGWKANFLDRSGYIVTGDNAAASTQYNLANTALGKDAAWVGYQAGQAEVQFSCGSCHTTGYQPAGNQDHLLGLVGTWSEAGVRCEACHGPGSNHEKNPYGTAMKVERTSEACGACHSRGATEVIPASGGFIEQNAQYNELAQSKHQALTCIACHDVHKGVVQGRETGTAAVKVECESCHFEQAEFQKSLVMKQLVKCIDCHMPRAVMSASGDASAFTGDIRSHLFAIDPYAASQFSHDGKAAISQLTLDFACKSCHRPNAPASVKSDEKIRQAAIGYHSRP